VGCVERLTSTDDDVVEVAEPADVDSGNAGAAEVSDGLAGSVISVGDDDAEDVGLIWVRLFLRDVRAPKPLVACWLALDLVLTGGR